VRAISAALLLCCSCAVGFAIRDGSECRAYGATLWSEIRACCPEGADGVCASVGAGGLSEEAAGVARDSGVLSFAKDALWGLAKWGLGLLW